MARIRSIKPDAFTDERFMNLSFAARLALIGTHVFSDDGGNHPASAKTLKAEVFPSDEITPEHVQGYVDEMHRQGFLITYEVDGKRYWHVSDWETYQRIDRPTLKYPGPAGKESDTTCQSLVEQSTNPRDALAEVSASAQRVLATDMDVDVDEDMEGKGNEKEGKGRARAARRTPMPDGFRISERVAAWACRKGYTRLPEQLEVFKSRVAANGYLKIDWDEFFMGAIRDDWAKLRSRAVASAPADRFAGNEI